VAALRSAPTRRKITIYGWSTRQQCPRIDRDYETLRINMQTLFHDLGITTNVTAA
jgi:hypothetical protein